MPRRRPAETAGAAGGVATILAAALGANTTTVAVIGAVAGALPGAVTWLVGHGGIRGVARAIWSGRR